MNVILHDFQNGPDDPFDGMLVDDLDNLRNILDQLQRRDPFILELEGDNGYRLTVGIGGPVSCIQHSSNDGEPPYLVAVPKDVKQRREEACVFLCGDQATEIRADQCVPFAVLRSVALHFLQTGDRSNEVDWVEGEGFDRNFTLRPSYMPRNVVSKSPYHPTKIGALSWGNPLDTRPNCDPSSRRTILYPSGPFSCPTSQTAKFRSFVRPFVT